MDWACRAHDCRHLVEVKCIENSENRFLLVPPPTINCIATVNDEADEEILARRLGGEIIVWGVFFFIIQSL